MGIILIPFTLIAVVIVNILAVAYFILMLPINIILWTFIGIGALFNSKEK